MRSVFSVALILGGLMAATQADAQIAAPFGGFGVPALQTAIGPDGTFYALAPATGSTYQSPSTEVTAISNSTGTTPKWTATIMGRVSQFLPGATALMPGSETTGG